MTEKSKYSGLKKVIGATALALGIGVWSSSYTIDQTEQAVVTRFGNPVRVILNPIKSGEEDNSVEELSQEYSEAGIRVNEGAGLYFKLPLVDSIRRFDRRLLRWNGYAEQIPTKDKKYIMVNTTARFRIYDPLKFLNTVGTEDQAHGRLDDIVDSTARNIITTKNLISVVRSDNRPMRVSEEELKENMQGIANLIQYSEEYPEGATKIGFYYYNVSALIEVLKDMKIRFAMGAETKTDRLMLEILSGLM